MKTHDKKLRNLTKSLSLAFTTTETVHNLSSKLLTTDELEVLKYGLKHPIHPLQITKTNILTTFDFIHRAMTNDLKDKKHSGELKTKMSHLANSYVNAYKATKNSLKKYNILKRLRESKDIVILRPDKGCGTVILDREEYVKKIYVIINDTSKFKKLSSDPTILREGQLQRFLRTLKNKGFFTDESYDKIYPSGSKPASIYGLPKIHKLNINKDNLSLRPIISSIGTYNYNLSKFLTNLLAPVIPTTNCTKDSFTFCEEIKKVRATNKFLISYDVCSLFTSIPLKETIDIAVNLLFEHKPGFKITKNELKKLFNSATSGTHFLFDVSFITKLMV